MSIKISEMLIAGYYLFSIQALKRTQKSNPGLEIIEVKVPSFQFEQVFMCA